MCALQILLHSERLTSFNFRWNTFFSSAFVIFLNKSIIFLFKAGTFVIILVVLFRPRVWAYFLSLNSLNFSAVGWICMVGTLESWIILSGLFAYHLQIANDRQADLNSIERELPKKFSSCSPTIFLGLIRKPARKEPLVYG